MLEIIGKWNNVIRKRTQRGIFASYKWKHKNQQHQNRECIHRILSHYNCNTYTVYVIYMCCVHSGTYTQVARSLFPLHMFALAYILQQWTSMEKTAIQAVYLFLVDLEWASLSLYLSISRSLCMSNTIFPFAGMFGHGLTHLIESKLYRGVCYERIEFRIYPYTEKEVNAVEGIKNYS